MKRKYKYKVVDLETGEEFFYTSFQWHLGFFIVAVVGFVSGISIVLINLN